MEHFTEEEWLEFKKGAYPSGKASHLEEHLRECEDCLKTFLNLIDEAEISRAEEIIPRDFTQSVICLVNQEPVTSRQTEMKVKKRVMKSQRLLVYYAAAAVLTLAFMGGGVFQSLIDGCPGVISAATQNSQKIEQRINGSLSDKIADKTSQWLFSFENHK